LLLLREIGLLPLLDAQTMTWRNLMKKPVTALYQKADCDAPIPEIAPA
jgi:hypothetical protein